MLNLAGSEPGVDLGGVTNSSLTAIPTTTAMPPRATSRRTEPVGEGMRPPSLLEPER